MTSNPLSFIIRCGFIAALPMLLLSACQSHPAGKSSCKMCGKMGSDTTTACPIFSPLAALPLKHSGRAMHEGSWDRTGGNRDFLTVAPGQTVTLLDYQGAGIIHRFWMTISPGNVQSLRQTILRIYWDNEKEPSVECPLGDFFGVGFGQEKDYVSLPLDETSGGFNCYWPMPFHKHARWTLENRSDKPIHAFYYNVDFTAYDSLPNDIQKFHACWRRENPTSPQHNYTILEAEGDGTYVGTALFMQGLNMGQNKLAFLEGDEMIYIDQPNPNPPTPKDWKHPEPVPQINGTGTEDYFCGGWYFRSGPYSAPYSGCVIKDDKNSRVSAYRWNIEDAIPFHKNIRVTIEHGSGDDTEADYSSVAYFYQSGPHEPYPPSPTNAADLLPSTP
jgi:D-arabinan exo alpha-(1,3)/(1,5)-arabinofuranosidase (non-reducing end)